MFLGFHQGGCLCQVKGDRLIGHCPMDWMRVAQTKTPLKTSPLAGCATLNWTETQHQEKPLAWGFVEKNRSGVRAGLRKDKFFQGVFLGLPLFGDVAFLGFEVD
jgi:hypothetical protein